MECTILLIRHGECDDDVFLRGHCDSSLSEAGSACMEAQLAKLSQSSKPDWVVSSSLSRCSDSAEKFCDFHQLPLQRDDDWRERDFGKWDGLSLSVLQESENNELENYFQAPFEYPIPEAETLENFKIRVQMTWQFLLKQLQTLQAQRVFIITHGGNIRVLLQHILKFPDEQLFQIEVGYGAVMTLKVIFAESVEGFNHEPFVMLQSIQQANGTK